MVTTASDHKNLHETYRLQGVREAIASESAEIQALIKRGEARIDLALNARDYQKWFGGVNYLDVFNIKEDIDPKVRTLLARRYKAVGFDIRWGDPATAKRNSVRMEYLREEP